MNGNGTSYIYFGSGEFDGQGSGHDFSGTVSFCCKARGCCCPLHLSLMLVARALRFVAKRIRPCVPVKASIASRVLPTTHLPFLLQLYMPPSGYVNSCDGGRSHTYWDYRQQ